MSLTGIGEAADAIKGIVDKFLPDKSEEAKNALALQIAVMQQDTAVMQMQADTNKAEASNPNLFVSGWRPFVGWVCGLSLAIVGFGPLLSWLASLCGHPTTFPAVDMSVTGPLLFSLLGFGGMRTFEKINGIKAGH